MALVLALAMVFSTITVAFAEEEVSAEAKALATIGMLEGDGGGVTADYTAKELNRFTAAIMILKLKGLYEDALKYDGVNNFADVAELKWAEGKKLLAYAKDNPVGFGGNEKGEFKPYDTLSEQMLYKVLLENLGYKQTTAEVTGDFAWEETLEFAEKLGLKPAKAEKFTVDGLSKAVASALKTKMKDGKVWINVLVDGGKVNKEKAIASGLYEDAVLTAKVKSVKAVGNTVVEVEFDAEVEKAAAEKLENYSIDGLEIKSAILDGTKKVLLETASQSSGKTYTLVVGDVKVNFGGKGKVAGAPEIKKVEGSDTERVKITFDKALDYETATNVANYTIANATIEKAELNADRNRVTLTAVGLKANKTHTVKVTGIKSADGAILKSASKSFYSKSDKVAPKIEKVETMTYTRILVKFNEELDKESAENIDNYTIKDLTVEKAVLVEDPVDEEDQWVEVTTSAQKAGTSYTLKVKGVKDTSVLGNEMVKEASAKFTGKSQDKTGPTVSKTTVLNRNRLLVEFNDASRIDFATIEDAANYEFNKDVTVEKAELTPGYDNDTKSVVLTVSDMAEKTTYKLTITGVTDEYGNEMKKAEKSINYSNTNLNASKITKVIATSDTKIEVYFDKHIDAETAKDVANYTINGDIGTPVAAKINSALTKITLTVNELTEGKNYKLTVNGVKDLAGNVLVASSNFVARTTENDIDAPEVEDITVVNRRVMRVTFSEPIYVKVVKNTAKSILDRGSDLTLNAVYDDNKVLEFSRNEDFQDIEYTLKGFVNVADKAGNKAVVDKEGLTFWGDKSEEDTIDFSWEQINVEKYKLIFSEKVAPKAGVTNKYEDDDADDLGMDTVWYLKKRVAVDKVAFKGDINNEFVSGHKGIKINNTEEDKVKETKITASMEDTDKPYIEGVEAQYRNKIKITFSEDVKTYGVYDISYYDLAGKLKKVSGQRGVADADDDNVVVLNLTSLSLESRFDYTLKVATQVQDLAGNKSEKDEEYSFQGTDLVAPNNYITGVEIINGTNFKVRLNSSETNVTKANTTLFLNPGDSDERKVNILSVAQDGTSTKIYKVEIAEPLQYGKKYEVTLAGYSYKFDGTVEDTVTFYEDNGYYLISYDGMSVGDNVTVNGKAVPVVIKNDEEVCTISKATVGEIKTILVKRDGVVLYYFEAEGAVAPPEIPEDAAKATYNVQIGAMNFKKVTITKVENLTGAAQFEVVGRKAAIGSTLTFMSGDNTASMNILNAAGEVIKTVTIDISADATGLEVEL